ncbi:MAG: hypothetical protein IT178_11110 [Acidobacteria bacterium]|nr:hypothetical protein [Acidobacteriota bacterium]
MRMTTVAMFTAVAMMTACGGPRVPDAANLLPFGFLDVPASGASVARVTRVAGWALDDGTIRRVDVYVDGRFAGSTSTGLARPDLPPALPNVAGAASGGWEIAIDLGEGTAPKQILAQAVDDTGATRDLGPVVVTVAAQ